VGDTCGLWFSITNSAARPSVMQLGVCGLAFSTRKFQVHLLPACLWNRMLDNALILRNIIRDQALECTET
jgi:hypothetical protein